MNKKSQLQTESYRFVSPLLIIGVVLFCIPIIMNIYTEVSPLLNGAFSFIGVIAIIFGAAASIHNSSG